MNSEFIKILDCFFLCSILVDIQGNIIYINKASTLFGYKQDELINENIQLFIPDHLKDIHLQYLLDPKYQSKRQQALNKHRNVKAKKKDNTTLNIHIIVHLLNIQNKNTFLVVCYDEIPIMSDISISLQQAKNEMKELQAITHLGTWEFDILNNKIVLSEELQKIYNTTKDTLTLEESYQFIYPDDLNYVKTEFENNIKNKQSINLLYRIYDTNHNLKYINAQGILHFKNDILYKITGHTLDISEKTVKEKEFNEELNDIKKIVDYKTTLLNHISHEIKSPLTGILGICNILENTPLQPEQKECLTLLNDCVQILVRMLNDILDHSKLQKSQLNVINEGFNIYELLNKIQLLYETFAVSKNNKIIVNIDKNVPMVLVSDPIRIKQILNNLVSNAIDFTENGSITINVCIENQFLKFTVSDTGCGIPENMRDKIFKPLLENTNYKYRKLGGSGLGLSICYNLVKLLDGEINYTSEINKGTTFNFTIKLH